MPHPQRARGGHVDESPHVYGRLPDVIVYPTGGGVGLIGIHKALAELRALGPELAAPAANGDPQPRLFAAQAEQCCPLVRAFEAGARFADAYPNAATAA